MEVLALIAEGRTNQQIAKLLFITAGTVRVHVHAILQVKCQRSHSSGDFGMATEVNWLVETGSFMSEDS